MGVLPHALISKFPCGVWAAALQSTARVTVVYRLKLSQAPLSILLELHPIPTRIRFLRSLVVVWSLHVLASALIDHASAPSATATHQRWPERPAIPSTANTHYGTPPQLPTSNVESTVQLLLTSVLTSSTGPVAPDAINYLLLLSAPSVDVFGSSHVAFLSTRLDAAVELMRSEQATECQKVQVAVETTAEVEREQVGVGRAVGCKLNLNLDPHPGPG